ncbi:SpdD protein [Actinacidiphila soli]|uniref:SpdD protein n=1 Tax=Actinacidiphila soli TaxID=2487275 RepID=UPI000FCC13AD|nr:SpdD protein [Actinacidiphila soli]
MLRPKLPVAPTPTHPTITAQHSHAPACSCQHVAPAPGSTPSLSVGAGVVGAVVLVGVVLTALLTAVAVSAVSVAIAAVVLRSLLRAQSRR